MSLREVIGFLRKNTLGALLANVGLALGIVLVFAAFNSSLVTIDGLLRALTLPLGVALVGFFALGSIAGALGLYLAVVLRLKRDLKRARSSGA